jgi:peptidoglycan hydrolase-like protein with peptidoglycan-binding domain
MFSRDIQILYNWITWGTRVYVSGGQFPYNIPWRTIRDGDRGSDVWLIQNRLKELGYLKGRPDGVYGPWTKQLMMRYQKDHKLPVTGVVDWSTRDKLGFYNFQ